MHIRPLDPDDDATVHLVARRMRDTLVEVVDPVRGATMYTHAWLVDRVRQHLGRPDRAVLLAVDGPVIGHTIVRVEADAVGLFSTTWVQPERRRGGVARALLDAGEAHLRGCGVRTLRTYTAATNAPLIGLYTTRGYRITRTHPSEGMVELTREVG